MAVITEHRNQHLRDEGMHEVKGFPSASIGYAYKKGIRGISEWSRVARQENVIATVTGYAAPLTEVDGDVYSIESPLLQIANINWQSGTTVRFTFDSGYSNIYAVGNYLQISGETIENHNGVWVITAVNASYLEVTNENITDATDDVTGSAATGYVSHQDYDPESLLNSQSIPRLGIVKYNATADLWYGDEFQIGDEYFELSTDSVKTLKSNGEVNSSSVITEVISIAKSDIIKLNTTPKVLVTCNSDEYIEVLTSSLVYDYADAGYGAGASVYLKYDGGVSITYAISAANSFGSTSDTINIAPVLGAAFAAIAGASVQLYSSVDFTAGSANGVGRLHITYKIHKTNL